MSGSVDDEIEALHARRRATRETHDAAYKAQHLIDLTALADLEDAHGCDRIVKVGIRGWEVGSGAVTMVVAKRPRKSDSLYKRFVDTLQRASKGDKVNSGEASKAGDLLAESCIVYPKVSKKGEPSYDGAYESTLELAPGLLTSVANELVTSAMGKAEEEGKG